MNARFLTVGEVAELLRVPITWVYARTRKRAANRIPGYRLGKYWRFQESEVLAWVQRQSEGARPTETTVENRQTVSFLR